MFRRVAASTEDRSRSRKANMESDIRVRAIALPQRDLLIEMYDRFDPLGGALGLPPRAAEARHEWMDAEVPC